MKKVGGEEWRNEQPIVDAGIVELREKMVAMEPNFSESLMLNHSAASIFRNYTNK